MITLYSYKWICILLCAVNYPLCSLSLYIYTKLNFFMNQIPPPPPPAAIGVLLGLFSTPLAKTINALNYA